MKHGHDRKEAPGRLPWRLAWALAVGQTISWGVLFYAFAVVIDPLQRQTGWSPTFIQGGVSIGLLTWGVCAFPVGVWTQRRGARGLMIVGTSAGAAGLLLMAMVVQPWMYLIGWILLGAGMAAVLYEPAFAVITQAFGAAYARGILLVTLVAGLASTLFLPLAQAAVGAWGWQEGLIVLALGQLIVCGPLYALVVPSRERVEVGGNRERRRRAGSWRVWPAEARDRRFIGLVVWLAAYALGFGGFIFVFVPMLSEQAVSAERMVRALMLIGPMQVAGRLLLAPAARTLSALKLAPWALAALAASLSLLLLTPVDSVALYLFTGLFGLGNGMLTLLRGTVVAEVFGTERYAVINGALAMPVVLAKALSPFALASLWSLSGTPAAVYLGGLVAVALSAFGVHLVQRPGRVGEGARQQVEVPLAAEAPRGLNQG
jgi:MFS family permease